MESNITKHAVLRIEADESNSDYDLLIDKVDDIEVNAKGLELYMEKLKSNNILKHSMYIGNAYFLETKGKSKEYLNEAFRLFKEDVKSVVTDGMIVTIEFDYYPEWALIKEVAL